MASINSRELYVYVSMTITFYCAAAAIAVYVHKSVGEVQKELSRVFVLLECVTG